MLVAQAQALLHIAVRDGLLKLWWPEGVPEVHPTFAELAVKAGVAHAEIASGRHDNQLAEVVGNALGRPKMDLLRRYLVRIQDFIRQPAFDRAAKWLKPACGIASTALGSMSFIPGVGAIKEGIDLIPAGLTSVKLLAEEQQRKLPDKPELEAGTQ